MSESRYTFEEIESISNYLKERTTHRPTIGIICGSGLGGLASLVTEPETFPYELIPKFPVSTVEGHEGKLIFGKLGNKVVVCMKGRFHAYEGYPFWKVTLPVRVMKLLGVEVLIVTNAAGGINPDYNICDIMVIDDHINIPGLAGNNPLVGPNDDRFGPRFPPTSYAYDPKLQYIVFEVAEELGFKHFIRNGVYAYVMGPNYETPAECRYLRTIGADVVGMSTAPEVIVAAHCGIRCLGLSLVTNVVVSTTKSNKVAASHTEVFESSNIRAADMQKLVSQFVQKI